VYPWICARIAGVARSSSSTRIGMSCSTYDWMYSCVNSAIAPYTRSKSPVPAATASLYRISSSRCRASRRAFTPASPILNAVAISVQSTSWLFSTALAPSSIRLPSTGSGGHGNATIAIARAQSSGIVDIVRADGGRGVRRRRALFICRVSTAGRVSAGPCESLRVLAKPVYDTTAILKNDWGP